MTKDELYQYAAIILSLLIFGATFFLATVQWALNYA